MADWAAHIKKYDSEAPDDVVAGLLKTYQLVLSKPDAAWVSFSDPQELATVRESFLKKKLGLSHSDAALDSAIAEVGDAMKDGTKNARVAVYYLLAKKYNKLSMFR